MLAWKQREQQYVMYTKSLECIQAQNWIIGFTAQYDLPCPSTGVFDNVEFWQASKSCRLYHKLNKYSNYRKESKCLRKCRFVTWHGLPRGSLGHAMVKCLLCQVFNSIHPQLTNFKELFPPLKVPIMSLPMFMMSSVLWSICPCSM